ncbi:medium-chain acyl-CoA ligase ACSF2, mitochondrial [Halyomorpha halys]|uniref:medium-chain acyl-CoA ligase ACSF2, mitochondrial n=1 Tax=Halyomorpha halys TaxID=286706 RepID=UPI0006D4CF81
MTLKACDGSDTNKKAAYYHNPGSQPLALMTTGQLLDQASQRWPDRDAIISPYEGKALSFLQTKIQAEQLGAGLLKLGLKPGDRLALLGVNSVHWYLTILAAAKAGIITVIFNPAYRAHELYSGLKCVRAKGIVTDHKFKTQDYPSMLMSLLDSTHSAPHGQPIKCTELPDLSLVIVATEEKLPGCYRFKDVQNLMSDTKVIKDIQSKIQPDDPVCIQFSSGTTGSPKATLLSHFGTINNVILTGQRMGFDNELSTLCLQVPFFHLFGSSLGILCGLHFGITLILSSPTFNPQHTADTLQNYKCDILYGTPTMFIDLCRELNKSFLTSAKVREACSNVKKILVGASFCPSEVCKELMDKFANCSLMNGHGLTETSCICFLTFQGDCLETKLKTVGRLMEHSEVKIVNREGKMVNFGTPGEACFRSYGNLLEYWGDEEKTKEVKSSSGWFKSGDIMILREDGYAQIVGRIKDMINRGGENIFPTEIEEFLLEHPQIINAQVYGVSDERMGEEVAASIQLCKPNTLSESTLKSYCKEKISHFKIPKYVRFVNQYPMTSSGKVQKYKLREEHEKELKQHFLKN